MIDRILDSLKALVREMLTPDEDDEAPVWAPFVPWEYQVSSVTETSFSGRATSSRCPWPDMVNIPLMPGVAGTLIKPAADSLVLVAFVNGDPTRPRCVGWDQTAPVSVTQDTTQTQTFSPSTTRVQITSAAVEVGSGTPPAQAVALAPAVVTALNALVSLCGAIATFGAATATFGAAAAGFGLAAGTAFGAAGTALATAAGSTSSTLGGLTGSYPSGVTATKLKTQ